MLFAAGLRYDVGQRLRGVLQGRGLQVEAGWHWSALPPVTATAKPALSPVADRLIGSPSGEKFCPLTTDGRRPLTSDRFRQLLESRELQVLAANSTGDPAGQAWTECGRIDRRGHDEGCLLARRIEEEVQTLAERTSALLAAGWKEVRIVTDHGWLLLPGGLPKTDLPVYLTEERWGRCALPRPEARTAVPLVPWHWSAAVWVAVAPGITCFVAGKEYAHGSLSLQECLVPWLSVRAAASTAPSARLGTVKWVGLRCRLTVEGETANLQVDLRTRAADERSSLAAPRAIQADGTTSLVVEDDGAEGTAVLLVLLSADGQVLDRKTTTVGGEK